MKSPLKIGEKVSIVRRMKDLSQSNVAHQMGISQQAYQQLERGETIMTEAKLTEIANILEVREQEIRDIDQVPIINKNLKHCQQFGNYKPTYYNEAVKENIAKTKEDEISEMKNEMSTMKVMLETLLNKLGGSDLSVG
jgi:transcriptional regulator with XRE-family HTH domain